MPDLLRVKTGLLFLKMMGKSDSSCSCMNPDPVLDRLVHLVLMYEIPDELAENVSV